MIYAIYLDALDQSWYDIFLCATLIHQWNRGTSDLLILLTVEAFPDLLASTADLFKCLSMWPFEVYVDKQFLYVKNVVGFQEDINSCKESFLFASITGNNPLIYISTNQCYHVCKYWENLGISSTRLALLLLQIKIVVRIHIFPPLTVNTQTY